MKIFESFKENFINENFLEVKFNSHKNHNPSTDIVEGKIDNDTIITYGIYVTDYSDIEKGTEFMELYVGENYVVGSKKRSNSRYYPADKIPAKYKKLWLNLKDMYERTYINESNDIDMSMDFGVIRKGGSIGQADNYVSNRHQGTLVKTFPDKESAKNYAKRLNKTLSPGEKSYYGIKYQVIEINPKYYTVDESIINERFWTTNRDQKDVYHRAIEYITGRDVERYHDEAKNYAYQIPKSKKWFTISKSEVDDVVKQHGGSLMKESDIIDILYNHNMSDDFVWTDSGLRAISPSVAKAISDLLSKEGIKSRVSGASVILQDKWLKGDTVKKIPNMTDEDLEDLIDQGHEHTAAREELKRRSRLKNKPFFVTEGKIKQYITDLEDLLNTNDLEDIEGICNKISKLLKLNKKEVEIVQNVIQQYKDKVDTDELAETILSKLS